MKRLNVILLAGMILFSTVFVNTAFCEQNAMLQKETEENSQVEQDEEYSHESVILDEEGETEYEDPQTDEVIRNDLDEEVEEGDYSETKEEGDEI